MWPNWRWFRTRLYVYAGVALTILLLAGLSQLVWLLLR